MSPAWMPLMKITDGQPFCLTCIGLFVVNGNDGLRQALIHWWPHSGGRDDSERVWMREIPISRGGNSHAGVLRFSPWGFQYFGMIEGGPVNFCLGWVGQSHLNSQTKFLPHSSHFPLPVKQAGIIVWLVIWRCKGIEVCYNQITLFDIFSLCRLDWKYDDVWSL